MSRASMHTEQFFADPKVERFKDIQRSARLSPNFDPFCTELLSIEANLLDANPTETLQRLGELVDAYQACPRFHYLEARVYEMLGDMVALGLAVQRLKTCLRMLAETGEGTKKSPFSVAFITDEDDLLRAIGEQKRCQQTVTSSHRQFDVLVAHSGEELWFDVTEIMRRRPTISHSELASG